jgi:5-methylcytosine-specific restriction endonuclease McrA
MNQFNLSEQNIKQLNDRELQSALEHAVVSLRQQELYVVRLMREADQRMLWAERGFSSFLKYCVAQFKMSEADFYRKKSLLETIRDVPEVEEQIALGEITATAVAYAATFFRQESKAQKCKISVDKKREVLQRLERASCDQAKRQLASMSSDFTVVRDRAVHRSDDRVIRTYTSNAALEGQIKRAEEVLAHRLPRGYDHADLLAKVFEIALSASDPVLKAERVKIKSPTTQSSTVDEKPCASMLAKPCNTKVAKRRAIKRSQIKAIYKQYEFKCSYRDLLTGKPCDSKHALEIDHVRPVSLGGDNASKNLRLLCRAHNRLAARQIIGVEKMARFGSR